MFFGAHVFNPRFYVFVYDILRFNRKAKRTLRSGQALYTLGSFLDEGGFSREFKEWYLYPMLGSIWSTSSKDLVSFSTLDTFRFLNGHKLLNVIFGSRWSTIPGGSRRYVDAVSKHISQHGARIFLGTPVLSVARNKESVTVRTKTGSETFDHVIFATHADTALSLIEEPSDAEREILGTFRYSVNDIVLHSDAAAMPTRRSAWASWNYTARTGDPHDARISLTYNMNALQHIDPAYPIYVTLNGTRPIKEALVHERFSYTHPQFSIATTKAQSRLAEIQGKHRTLFAGAHWGFGFHEDGVASGIEAVKSLGIAVPWSI
jgi:predicted NAD/FAD-binding protein